MLYRCWYTPISDDKTRFSNFLIYPKNNQIFFVSEQAHIFKISPFWRFDKKKY